MMRRTIWIGMLILFPLAALAQENADAPDSGGPIVVTDGMTQEEKFAVKELTQISDEVGKELPLTMNLEDPKYREMFPLAISEENPWWYTIGADRFLVFRYPKSEPFRDRRGRFIRPPGSSHWAYLVAEDNANFYFQWMPPGAPLSPEHHEKTRTQMMAPARDQMVKGAEEASEEKVDLRRYLGAPGHPIPEEPASIMPAEVDRLVFGEGSLGLPQSGLWQEGIAMGDMNGDGHLDVVTPPARKQIGGKPIIWLGDSQGRWMPWRAARYPDRVQFDYGDIGVADFDGDGHQDFAVAMHFKGVYVFYGDGRGDFTDHFKFFDGSGFTSRALAIADFDGDERPDLAVLSEINMDPKTQLGVVGRMLRVFLYRERQFFEPRDEGTTPHLIGDQLASADLNADGRPDLIASSHVHGHTALLHLNEGEEGWRVWREKLLARSYYWGVAGGDLNGDGYDDLVVSYVVVERHPKLERGGVVVFYSNEGKGLGDPVHIIREERPIPHPFIELADLDKDGRLDIVTCSYEGKFRILVQNEKGEFLLEQSPEMPTLIAQGAVIEDVNRDGWLDLVVNYSSEEMGGAIKCWFGGSAAAAK